jgi:hypothetical protein
MVPGSPDPDVGPRLSVDRSLVANVGRLVSILGDDRDETEVALAVPEKGGDALVPCNETARRTLAGRLD